MVLSLKVKKVLYRLFILLVITTPLFAILGGTPFFRFTFKEFRYFLPGVYFTAFLALSFWIINISLLLIAENYAVIRNIFTRAAISVTLGVLISTAAFSFLDPMKRPAGADASGVPGTTPAALLRPTEPGGLRPGDTAFSGARALQFPAPAPKFIILSMVLRTLTINLIILTLCELVFMHYVKQLVEDENVQLRQMNLEAKNSQLKMQLHPHFLFNSLNTLRLLLKKDPNKAEHYLVMLSDMLRFSTTAALHNVVDIADELNLCMTYLEMQKVRFDDMLHFSVTNDELFSAKGKLPVYSLQLLAENAIKHNALTNEAPLTIYLDYDPLQKTITVRNKIQPKRTMEATTKTGLTNLDKRYKLLNNKGILIAEENGEFSVSINVL